MLSLAPRARRSDQTANLRNDQAIEIFKGVGSELFAQCANISSKALAEVAKAEPDVKAIIAERVEAGEFFTAAQVKDIKDKAAKEADEFKAKLDAAEKAALEAAERIKLRLRRSAEDIIEIGRDLIEVKTSIGHGNFLPWIEAEFGMGRTTAWKFMAVAETYGSNVHLVNNLDPSALYELAAPKTPLEVREEIERMLAAGEVVTALQRRLLPDTFPPVFHDLYQPVEPRQYSIDREPEQRR